MFFLNRSLKISFCSSVSCFFFLKNINSPTSTNLFSGNLNIIPSPSLSTIHQSGNTVLILLAFPSVEGLTEIITQILSIYKIYDYVAFTLTIIFIIGIGYTSYKIRASPIFYIITIITSAFYGFIAFCLSYMFSIFASDPVFVVILHIFSLTILVLTNLHWIALIMIIIGAIALYSSGSNEDIPLR